MRALCARAADHSRHGVSHPGKASREQKSVSDGREGRGKRCIPVRHAVRARDMCGGPCIRPGGTVAVCVSLSTCPR
ncbi:hypothetical protein GH5_02510 [Leishmania sp. Ghana 2012 LV757]|uniref:hypothetical protein n=1 Tax=Leishmania sp. Ghana 2012 LV757 TaxID=2803181 RepID=UPI001B68118C|nr:hypothetical protein GH5_02510 [Leishmania sp. Ghana 2012 LV757]